jgi:hypothetical protein
LTTKFTPAARAIAAKPAAILVFHSATAFAPRATASRSRGGSSTTFEKLSSFVMYSLSFVFSSHEYSRHMRNVSAM